MKYSSVMMRVFLLLDENNNSCQYPRHILAIIALTAFAHPGRTVHNSGSLATLSQPKLFRIGQMSLTYLFPYKDDSNFCEF